MINSTSNLEPVAPMPQTFNPFIGMVIIVIVLAVFLSLSFYIDRKRPKILYSIKAKAVICPNCKKRIELT